MPVHSGPSPRVMVVAQEVDGLAVHPGDGTQTSPARQFLPAPFCQPPAELLGVVLASWHDGARGQDSQFVLQQVEERDGIVKAVHEQHVVLVGDLRVLASHSRKLSIPNLTGLSRMYCLMGRLFLVGIEPSLRLSCWWGL